MVVEDSSTHTRSAAVGLREPEQPTIRRGRVQRVVEAAERLGIVRALRGLHDRWPALTVLAYHRVMPTDGLAAYPFDPQLISATPEQFDWQMRYVREHLNPVSLSDVMGHLDGKVALPPASVAVTFDDGFMDTYRYAFPALKRFSIPATVFVATGYVDSGEPFWFELASYLALRVKPESLEIAGSGEAFPRGDSREERTSSLLRLHQILQSLPNARRTEAVSQWARRFAVQIAHGEIARSRPISWEQVSEMAEAGIDFGSHTVTHPNLTRLTDDELDWELAESKRVLEARLQKPVDAVAYPIGTTAAFDARVVAATERQGFKLGVTYVPGANRLQSISRYELRRRGISPTTTPPYFRAMTSLPSWIG
jgi:peptidoglycan/xylan/chitin deacetylase (PgdA/CDA1 family)